jgi:hypothetical protein
VKPRRLHLRLGFSGKHKAPLPPERLAEQSHSCGTRSPVASLAIGRVHAERSTDLSKRGGRA